MRMNARNVAILVIILTFVFVYTIHINWKQKKELSAFLRETEVLEKHIDELTAKLNECTERKQQWGIKFENAKRQAAELQTSLNAARSLASKSQVESSDKARQSSERLSDLESQVKQLTELRSGLEQENANLRKQQQERLSNDSDALTLLHKQLDKALANEKLLQKRIDTLESLTKKQSEKTTNTVDASTATLNFSSTSSANPTSTSGLVTSSVAANSSTVNSTKSIKITDQSASSAASEDLTQAKMVLRPPNKNVLKKSNENAKLQQGDNPAAAVAAPGAGSDEAPAAAI